MKTNFLRSAKKILNSNWFITIFSTTVGVLLAFYVNDLGERFSTNQRKKNALDNIIQEISQNRDDLKAQKVNDTLLDYLVEIKSLNEEISTTFTAHPDSFRVLLAKVPVMALIDSVALSDTVYQYKVKFNFHLTLNDPPQIAWEAAKLADVPNELSYECLEVLVDVYAIQQLYVEEERKLLDLLLEGKHVKMLRTLAMVKSIKKQLLEQYRKTLQQLTNCD
ncbi:MAG: hypothetical protein ACFB0B_12070 [Thermonemataceae bacterium]